MYYFLPLISWWLFFSLFSVHAFFFLTKTPLSRRHSQQLSTRLYKTRIRLKWARILVASMFPRIYIFFSAFKGGEKKEEEHFLEINNRDSAKIFKRRSKNIQDLAVNHWHLLRRLQETMKVLTYESVSCLYLPLVSFHHAEAVLPALSGLWQRSNSPFLSLPNSSGQRPHQQQPGGSFVLFFVFFFIYFY